MSGLVALVGRPNVGKSTLFNRLTRSRDALVADLPGLTRDRQYGLATLGGRSLVLVDTGGLTDADAALDAAAARQAELAIEEADLVLLLVDARSGVTAADEVIAERLRRQGRPALLVVNKTDGLDEDAALAEFAALGYDTTLALSATHGRGVRRLEAAILAALSPETGAATAAFERHGTVVGVVGRPNVGKSTLVNRMLGEERVVVYDEAGTTRDAIFVPYERAGRPYTLVDTAGVRRRGRVRDVVEKFSVAKTLAAIDAADVVVVLVDAREGLVDQDLHLLGAVLEHGRAAVIAVNKWDGLAPAQRDDVRAQLDRRLAFAPWIRCHFVSALHGSGVGELYESIDVAREAASADLATSELTRVLEQAVKEHPPPLVRGRRIKLRYAHQGGSRPPRIVAHGNQVAALPESYRRYLENVFREAFNLAGTPLALELRSGANPYAGRRNTLTPRQQRKRRRLQKHAAKASRARK